ncbi:hypothetical protein ACFVYA_43210 [Amycolatopsis sp. NPDC058278]|uniref:hypothetical protein n=1 Tax=Amycolatopsis sp. NPDC058278 TaxID=3346417 RepID=UPI0036DCEBC8
MGSWGRRPPFWLYAVSLPLAFAAARVIRQPSPARTREKLPPLPWRTFRTPAAVTLAGGLVFYVLVVELSYVLDGIGATATATVGLLSAAGSLATAIAAYLFPRLAKPGPAATIPATFVLCGLGILVLAPASSVPVVVLGAVVTGLGNGLLLPALLTRALGRRHHRPLPGLLVVGAAALLLALVVFGGSRLSGTR